MAEKTYCLYNNEEILDQRLAVEIGNTYLVLVSGSVNKISGIEFYTADEMSLEDLLEEVSRHSALLKKNYSETRVFYNLPETVLVPAAQFNTSIASELVDLAYGNKPSSRVNVENINISPGIVNVYRSHDNWQEIINRYFRAVTKRHLHSRLVEHAIAHNEQLATVFYKESMTVVAAGKHHLKLVRNFSFSNDADVLYHLLNVCKQVDIDAAKCTLSISGFIETGSSTFLLLKKYFGRLKPDNTANEALPAEQQDTYPHHFFTSFINLLS